MRVKKGAAAALGLLWDFDPGRASAGRPGHAKTASMAAPHAPARGRKCAYLRRNPPRVRRGGDRVSLLALGAKLGPAFAPAFGQWPVRDPLADHSGGTAPDSHRLPRSAVTLSPSITASETRRVIRAEPGGGYARSDTQPTGLAIELLATETENAPNGRGLRPPVPPRRQRHRRAPQARHDARHPAAQPCSHSALRGLLHIMCRCRATASGQPGPTTSTRRGA